MNVRGIFPSLGAGGSLTAAVLCAAAIVGGGLAFRGEAGGTAEANTGDVNVPGATVRAQAPPPPRSAPAGNPGASAARRPAPRVAAAPPRATTRTIVRRSTPTQRAGITPRAPVSAPGPAPTPAPTPAPGAKPSPAVPVPALPVPPTPSGTVQQVTEPVVDALAEPARRPVQTVTDTVQQAAGVVDQTVDGLLP